jgi:uncharacterized protein (TIGR00730 family)
MKSVCVFTGSNFGARASYAAAARDLGHLLAARGMGLVYGGGRVGLMGVIAEAVLERGGHVLGVTPQSLVEKEVVHLGLSDLRVVDTMHERKALMADHADGFIAMPGGFGTLDEFFEIITWAQLGLHRKPSGFLNVDGYFDPLIRFIDHSVVEGFVRREHAASIVVSASPTELLERMATHRPPVVEKWIARADT